MAKTPKISVLLPLYNEELIIQESVNSILSQTYTDFELLVIDDGSTDNSVDKINEITDPRVRLIKLPHRGISAALNMGIQAAQGEYIARMDSDDICSEDRFMKQVDFLDKNPDYGLIGSCCQIVDENGVLLLHFKAPTTDKEIRSRMNSYNPFVHSSIMMRKVILDKVGRYKYFHNEDYDLWWRMLAVTKGYNFPDELVIRTHRQNTYYRFKKSIHHRQKLRVQVRALIERNANLTILPSIFLSGAAFIGYAILEFFPDRNRK